MTDADIRAISYSGAYLRGKEYVRQGRVHHIEPQGDLLRWTAEVHGTSVYHVTVQFRPDRSTPWERIGRACTCPAFEDAAICKHVVAVLLMLEPTVLTFLDGKPIDPKLERAHNNATRLLAMARQTRQHAQAARHARPGSQASSVHAKTKLNVEYQLTPMAFDFGLGDTMHLEMKVGPKKPYVVRKVKDFLDAVRDGAGYGFTSRFSYDPDEHLFSQADLEIFRILQRIADEERFYRDRLHTYGRAADDRSLFLPPTVWPELAPLLEVTNTSVHNRGNNGPMQLANGVLPLIFSVHALDEHLYSLRMEGMQRMSLLPRYGYAVVQSAFYELDPVQFEQLQSLRDLLAGSDTKEFPITADDLEPVMNEVIPGLRRIAQVEIDEGIADRVVEYPLEAKLYLDRETGWGVSDEVLTARLEFIYGGVEVGGHEQDQQLANQILVRDLEKENRITHLLQEARFRPNGEQRVLVGEEAIYLFLTHFLPELESLAEVYATTAVDNWMPPAGVNVHTHLDMQADNDWLSVSFDLTGINQEEIYEVLQALIERKRYHRLKNGQFLSLEDKAFSDMGQTLQELRVSARDLKHAKNTGPEDALLRLPSVRALSLLDSETPTHAKFGKSLRHFLDNLRNPDNLEFPLPTGLEASLRPYQQFGFQWMKTLSHYGFGGILADDMGLGKTIQSITYLLSERAASQTAAPDAAAEGASGSPAVLDPALIVCPASLTWNWKSEIDRFAPSLRAVVMTGDKADREEILANRHEYDVIMTSYPLLWRDLDAYQGLTFSTLILDEAQAVKNHTTATAKAVAAIESPHRFALTGTPIENSMEDLWSIFHAIFPDLVGSRLGFTALSREDVARRVRPFILRRLKRDVLTELPEKIETLQTAELTMEQKTLYLAYLSQFKEQTERELADGGFQKGRFQILAGLTRLRQICCHPALCVEGYNGPSGKLNLLLELVDDYMAAGQRMLIFSQFTSMLDIIRAALTEKGVPYLYLDGQTPASERLGLCETFNHGTMPVFLISLRAGGTGLNLTGADTVILYDLWWNPAVEQQAADRAHRIGQQKTVQVIRMVTQGTIEEKMHALQQRKRELIDAVVQANDEGLGALTEEDVRTLLSV